MQSDGFNSALSPVVHGDIALSMNTQYNTQTPYLEFEIQFQIRDWSHQTTEKVILCYPLAGPV